MTAPLAFGGFCLGDLKVKMILKLKLRERKVVWLEKMPRKLKKDEQKFGFEELRARAVEKKIRLR